jgi:hypothetical protein
MTHSSKGETEDHQFWHAGRFLSDDLSKTIRGSGCSPVPMAFMPQSRMGAAASEPRCRCVYLHHCLGPLLGPPHGRTWLRSATGKRAPPRVVMRSLRCAGPPGAIGQKRRLRSSCLGADLAVAIAVCRRGPRSAKHPGRPRRAERRDGVCRPWWACQDASLGVSASCLITLLSRPKERGVCCQILFLDIEVLMEPQHLRTPAAIIPARAARRRLVNAINPPDPSGSVFAPHSPNLAGRCPLIENRCWTVWCWTIDIARELAQMTPTPRTRPCGLVL